MDFFTTWVSGLKLDMWTIGLIFASVVAIPVLYILYRTFRPAADKLATREDSSAPSSDHFQVQQEEGPPTSSLPDEASSEHLAPSQDIPE
jgi:hypothetical protein